MLCITGMQALLRYRKAVLRHRFFEASCPLLLWSPLQPCYGLTEERGHSLRQLATAVHCEERPISFFPPLNAPASRSHTVQHASPNLSCLWCSHTFRTGESYADGPGEQCLTSHLALQEGVLLKGA